MDFSLLYIPNGLVEHVNITKISFKLFPLMLCMNNIMQFPILSLCSFSFKMFDHIIVVKNLYRYK